MRHSPWAWTALALSLWLTTPRLAAQDGPEATIVPFLGVGSRSGEWPLFYLGAQLEHGLSSRVRIGISAAGWGTPLVCTPSGDPDTDQARCADSGWLADAGVRASFFTTGGVRGYGGVGGGAMRVGKTYFAPHLLLGVDLPRASAIGLRLEARYQHAVSAPSPDFVTLTAGIRIH
jgi:hypothetical protein